MMDTTPAKQRDSWLSGLLSTLMTLAVLVILTAAVALAVVPRVLDGAALTVLTGSMVPTYNPGDVVVVRGVDDAETEVQIGDVVSFQPKPNDPTLITHRVVATSFTSEGTRFVTRGDANSADDEPLLPEQIKAEVVYSIPWVGHVSLWLGQRRALAVTGAAVALFAYATVMIFRRDPKKAAAAPATTPDQTADEAPVDEAALDAMSGAHR
jgi:signal peptidase I